MTKDRPAPESDFAQLLDPTTIKLTRILPGPIELVWAYLTEAEKRGKWFCSGEMELREGGAFELRFQHTNLSHEKEFPEKYKEMADGVVYHATITKCDRPHLLTFTWGSGEKASEVTFELTPEGDHVRLVLTHRRLVDRAERNGTATGWHAHIDILEDILNQRERRGFWSNHTRLESEYERRFGNR